MVADYKIYLTIGDVRVEMSNFISKLSLSFQHNLCSTSWKSVTDTASCTLQFNDRNIPQLAEVVSKLIEAQQAFPPEEVKFEAVSKDDETTYFYGYLDLGKLSVESSKLPGSVSLTAKSFMDKLDVKPHVNFVLYPSTVREVVEKCLVEAGFTDNIKWISSVGGMKVQVPFVVTEDDSDTWRDKIDTLLSEMGGYTLSYDHKDKSFFVSKVNDESKEVSDTPIRYHVQTKLKSTSTKYAKAEATYTKLMSDYNKNKTQAAYAYLTRDLKKVVSPMYKESRTYFERLRKNEPENKTYIKYLVYINDRLSNEKEVARLKKLL